MGVKGDGSERVASELDAGDLDDDGGDEDDDEERVVEEVREDVDFCGF